jgi:DNA-binding MarR family transcriptional regulator
MTTKSGFTIKPTAQPTSRANATKRLASQSDTDLDSKQLGLLLTRLTRDFQKRHDDKAERFHVSGLRSSHSAVTVYLALRPHRLTELAELNSMRPQSMLKIINELEALGFVERVNDPQDTRAKLVQFTAEGKKMLTVSTHASDDIYQQYANIIGEQALQSMLDNMQDLLKGLEPSHQ